MRDHVGMLHLCDRGNGLDHSAICMIVATLFGQENRAETVMVGFEFVGPNRSSIRAAQAYAEARLLWHSYIATFQLN